MDVRRAVEQLKGRRRNVSPNELDTMLTAAGFAYRWGGRNHAIYSHPKLTYNVTVKQNEPLLPTYVSKAIRAIEEVLDDEDN